MSSTRTPDASASRVVVSRRADERWEAAAQEHHEALQMYLDAAAALSSEAWTRPWAPGKWTPAEITEHLTLSYEALLAEVCEGRAMALKMTPLRRRILRWVLLPHILFHRSFPLKARSPREVRPGAPRASRDEALRTMRSLGERFEAELDRARRTRPVVLTHPYFGSVDAVKGMRFVAVHVEHHAVQLEKAGK